MCHQAQKDFRGIFVGIPQHQKRSLVYVPITRKILSSYDVVFDESFSSALVYTSQPHSQVMTMRRSVKYTPRAVSLREQTSDIITITQFEEGDLLSEIRNDTEIDDESGDECDDDSINKILLSVEEMDVLDFGDDSDDDPMHKEMLEDICD